MFSKLQSTIIRCLFVPKLVLISEVHEVRVWAVQQRKISEKGGVEQVELREVMSV